MPYTGVRLQTIIPNSNIVIDRWNSTEREDPLIRFMTSIKNHSVKSISQMRRANYQIHTSLFNKWYLHQFYEISESRITVLDYNKTLEIFDPNRNEKFYVTAIEANYCSGSTMFLFQGPFGNILYTGYFRTSASTRIHDSPALKQLIEDRNLHEAYIDNSYAAEHCSFPSRQETIQKIINFVRGSKTSKIIISSNPLGKEEVLLALGSQLDEKIHVSQQRFDVFSKLGVSDFFTKNLKESRIQALDSLLSVKECSQIFAEDRSCLVILLTALYVYGPKRFPQKSSFPRLHIIPYSGHCNHFELKKFLSALRPHSIFPIVKAKLRHHPCSEIPQSLYDLCYKADNGDGSNDEVSEPISNSEAISVSEPICETYLPIILIPRLTEFPAHESQCNLPTTCSMESKQTELATCSAVRESDIATDECSQDSWKTTDNTCDRTASVSVPFEDLSTENDDDESCAAQEEYSATREIHKSIVECVNEEVQLPQRTPTCKSFSNNDSLVDEFLTETDVQNSPTVGNSNLATASSLNGIYIRADSCDDPLSDSVRSNTDARMDHVSAEMQPSAVEEAEEYFSDYDQLVYEYPIVAEDTNIDDTSKSNSSFLHSSRASNACEDAQFAENVRCADSTNAEITLELDSDRVESADDSNRVPRVEINENIVENESNSLTKLSQYSDNLTEPNLLPILTRSLQLESKITVSLTVNADFTSSLLRSTPLSDNNDANDGGKDDVSNLSSNRDVTLFEPDERSSENLFVDEDVSGVFETNVAGVESVSSVLEDSDLVVETNRSVVNNSSLSSQRIPADCPGSRKIDSDSDDCMIVDEYMADAEFDGHVPKKRRLDSEHNFTKNALSNKNYPFVNAILFHYSKLYEQEKAPVTFGQWDFLAGCKIFSHRAYKRL